MPELDSKARVRRAVARVVVGVGGLLSVFGLLLIVAAFVEDAAIENHVGRAEAEVVSVAFHRTLVRFTTPDGAEQVPSVGVLYPEHLEEGQVVRVEYDARNPDLVRVAGRGAALTILPVTSLLAAVWAVAGVVLWWLRKQGPLHLRPPHRTKRV
ncbi:MULTISPECIES: DUF3592 domain-containing protein [Actinokineospora]|uniref:DUF3592 domain-containing protein n=1 Tax=Actinokineospora fastidiosa TaxID=1816 RepID=A0A918G7E5_9PSEU|nr:MULTISPECIES: DUF3592 domain-containing protein [Actinokineospora]UVS82267.1 hypothetical protein Actkin_06036 [Actinokineospora sp. UTMC 2448]GGS22429.1 hypothetical protein GCM10010171_14080 [Actinokineospora fastidiosa]